MNVVHTDRAVETLPQDSSTGCSSVPSSNSDVDANDSLDMIATRIEHTAEVIVIAIRIAFDIVFQCILEWWRFC